MELWREYGRGSRKETLRYFGDQLFSFTFLETHAKPRMRNGCWQTQQLGSNGSSGIHAKESESWMKVGENDCWRLSGCTGGGKSLVASPVCPKRREFQVWKTCIVKFVVLRTEATPDHLTQYCNRVSTVVTEMIDGSVMCQTIRNLRRKWLQILYHWSTTDTNVLQFGTRNYTTHTFWHVAYHILSHSQSWHPPNPKPCPTNHNIRLTNFSICHSYVNS